MPTRLVMLGIPGSALCSVKGSADRNGSPSTVAPSARKTVRSVSSSSIRVLPPLSDAVDRAGEGLQDRLRDGGQASGADVVQVLGHRTEMLDVRVPPYIEAVHAIEQPGCSNPQKVGHARGGAHADDCRDAGLAGRGILPDCLLGRVPLLAEVAIVHAVADRGCQHRQKGGVVGTGRIDYEVRAGEQGIERRRIGNVRRRGARLAAERIGAGLGAAQVASGDDEFIDLFALPQQPARCGAEAACPAEDDDLHGSPLSRTFPAARYQQTPQITALYEDFWPMASGLAPVPIYPFGASYAQCSATLSGPWCIWCRDRAGDSGSLVGYRIPPWSRSGRSAASTARPGEP